MLHDHAANDGQIDFAGWLFRLLTWDGVLPVCILAVPGLIERAVPNRGAIEFAAVALPTAFFFVRIVKGCHHIDGNHCGPGFQRLQVWALVVGVFVLVFLDAIMILSHVMPRGALNGGDFQVMAIMLAIYLIPMAVAMYPGRSKPLSEVWRPK
jgi:hypothetical protein